MNRYSYIGSDNRLYPFTSSLESRGGVNDRNSKRRNIEQGAKSRTSSRAVMLPRPDFEVKVVDLPRRKTEIRHILELNLSGLYPGNPEETVFDYKKTGQRRAVLFITRRTVLENLRSLVGKSRLFLPHSLVRKRVLKESSERTICTFWWHEWFEVSLFEGGELRFSRVYNRSLSEKYLDLADDFTGATHHMFCARREKGMLESVIPAPDRVFILEDEIRRVRGREDFIFSAETSPVKRYKTGFAAVLIAAAVLTSLAITGNRIRSRRIVLAHLKERLEVKERTEVLLERIAAVEKELELLGKYRPVSVYDFLVDLSASSGWRTKIKQLNMSGNGNFQIDGTGPEPFSLMSVLEDHKNFSDIKLPGTFRDLEADGDRFNLSGVYSD